MIRTFAVVMTLLAATPPADLPVEQTKKNIKVLQGLPTSQLIPVMAVMSNSLGVTCAHCHEKEWESDAKPAKDSARNMITMQRALNVQQYGGKPTITCNTCHRGEVQLRPTPDLANAGWNARPAAREPELIAGADAIARLPEPPPGVTKREIRGTVERYNGRDAPKSAPFTLTITADSVKYNTELSHPPEASRALGLYLLHRLKPEQVSGERWSIDANAIRRYRETPTPVGNLPEAIDYSDFRDTASGRLPFRAQWSRADYRVTFTVEEVR